MIDKRGTTSLLETLRHSRTSQQTHTYYFVEVTLSQATLFLKPSYI